MRVSKVPAQATEEEVRAALAGVGDVKSAVIDGNGVWFARVAPAEGDGVEQLRAKVSAAMRAKGAADRKEKAAKKEAAMKAEEQAEAAKKAAVEAAAKQEAEQEPAAAVEAAVEAAEGEAKVEVKMEEVKAEEVKAEEEATEEVKAAEEATEEVKMEEADKEEEAKKEAARKEEEAARKQEEEDALAGDAMTIHGVRVHLDHVEKPSWFLFIGNLCASYDDAKLVELFAQCGSTERCFVMTNKDGTTKGYVPRTHTGKKRHSPTLSTRLHSTQGKRPPRP